MVGVHRKFDDRKFPGSAVVEMGGVQGVKCGRRCVEGRCWYGSNIGVGLRVELWLVQTEHLVHRKDDPND